MADHQTCPHPFETWTKETNLYSYRCGECNDRPCMDCKRYGDRGFMIPLVSWMTGVCEDCYHIREQRQKIRDNYYRDVRGRESRARIWDEGRAAAPDAANPYAEPGVFESSALEQHEWLRAEAGEPA